MRYIVMLIIAIALLLTIAACSSKSGKLSKQGEIQAELDVEMEQMRQIEIELGYDAIIVENADASYKILNDSVAVRIEDDVFFQKRRAKDINMGYWRYYRVY